MSSRTPNEEKALAWYCQEKGLIPQLSSHPIYNFIEKETGKKSEEHIQNIVRGWQESKKPGGKRGS